MQTRNGSLNADINYGNASGSVVIHSSTFNLPLQQDIDTLGEWSLSSKVDVSFTSISNDLCSSDFDIAIMNALDIGKYQSCLLDLYSFDFGLGQNIPAAILMNGISHDRLIALPFEHSSHILLYNNDYLGSHGYYQPPSTLQEMTSMVIDILTNERGAENYDVTGFATAFSDPQMMVSLLAEWSAGVGGSILDSTSNSLATGNFTAVLSYLVSWLDQGVLKLDDLSLNENDVWSSFLERKYIFIQVDSKILTQRDVSSIPFNYGVMKMPGMSLTRDSSSLIVSGDASGTLCGTYLSISKHSSNPAASLKAVQYLTSQGYQKKSLTSPLAKPFVEAYYPGLLTDELFCNQYAFGCSLSSQLAAKRPSTLSETLYSNVTSIINTQMISILSGFVEVTLGVSQIDDLLRSLLSFPKRFDTFNEPIVTATPTRPRFKNFIEQVFGLLLGVTAIITGIVLWRRKQRYDEMNGVNEVLPTAKRANNDYSETALLVL